MKPRSSVCLLDDRSGNIALMTAILLPLMLAATGGAIDFSRRALVQTSMQEAADAGALAGAFAYVHRTDMDLTSGQAAHRTFLGNTSLTELEKGFKRTWKWAKPHQILEYKITGKVKTTFLGLFGIKSLAVEAVAWSEVISPMPTEMSIIVDTTNSMGFDNTWEVTMNTLEDVLEHMEKHAATNEFYASLVPFSDRVNVGRQDWLDGAAPAGWNGCFEPREKRDGKYEFALNTNPPATDKFIASIPGVTGGLASRGAPYPNCPVVPITGPTDDPKEISAAAKKFTKSGTGRPDVGMAWAWRLFSREWVNKWDVTGYPKPGTQARKIAVLITDGLTTAYAHEMSETEDWGWNNGSKEGFEHLVHICEGMKKDGIEIYVFRINGNDHAETYFQDCASEGSNYRTINTNEDLAEAFEILIDEDATIRLVK